ESDTTSFPNVAKHFDQNAQSVLRSSSNTLGADIGKFMGDGAHRVNVWRIQLLRTMSRILGVNGLVKSMMTTKGMFFFKFSSKDGMDAMIENDPWLIHNVPLILKKWTPDANIMKEHVCNIPVWVKFHDIPSTVFSEDDLTMCLDSWDKSSYARAMVELRADIELKDTLVVAIPKFMGEGYNMSTIRVEYEWTPPR
ncbi:putative reverse transcriptase domain-containing protein, partial [Tanacetum coccineum]